MLRQLGIRPVLHQPRYSLFDRVPEGGLLEVLTNLGIGCIAFSPLAQGLLTPKYLDGTVPTGSRASRSRYLDGTAITADYLARARGLNRLAASLGLSLPTLALAWLLQRPSVSSVLIGASSPFQLKQNLAALQVPPLGAETLAAIDRFAAAPGEAL